MKRFCGGGAFRCGRLHFFPMPANANLRGVRQHTIGCIRRLPSPALKTYADHCAICHGDNREGNLPAFPPLLGISHQMTDDQITQIVRSGRGRMPGFPKLGQDELTALLQYLATDQQPASHRDKGVVGVVQSCPSGQPPVPAELRVLPWTGCAGWRIGSRSYAVEASTPRPWRKHYL